MELDTSGRLPSTKRGLPTDLYYQACLNNGDAFGREEYLMTTYERMYLKNRLRDY
jgi:hypothetical protein